MAKPAPNLAPRLVNREAAAAYCGVCATSFSTYVEPHVPALELGTRRLWDVRMIDAWIDRYTSPVDNAGTKEEWLGRV